MPPAGRCGRALSQHPPAPSERQDRLPSLSRPSLGAAAGLEESPESWTPMRRSRGQHEAGGRGAVFGNGCLACLASGSEAVPGFVTASWDRHPAPGRTAHPHPPESLRSPSQTWSERPEHGAQSAPLHESGVSPRRVPECEAQNQAQGGEALLQEAHKSLAEPQKLACRSQHWVPAAWT